MNNEEMFQAALNYSKANTIGAILAVGLILALVWAWTGIWEAL